MNFIHKCQNRGESILSARWRECSMFKVSTMFRYILIDQSDQMLYVAIKD